MPPKLHPIAKNLINLVEKHNNEFSSLNDGDDEFLSLNQIDNIRNDGPKSVHGKVMAFSSDEDSSDEEDDDKFVLDVANLEEETNSDILKSTLPEILSKMECLCMGNNVENLTINEIKQILYNDYKPQPSIGDYSISVIKDKLKEHLNNEDFNAIGEMTLNEISKKLNEPKRQNFFELLQSSPPIRRWNSSPLEFSDSPENKSPDESDSQIRENKNLRSILKKPNNQEQQLANWFVPPVVRPRSKQSLLLPPPPHYPPPMRPTQFQIPNQSSKPRPQLVPRPPLPFATVEQPYASFQPIHQYTVPPLLTTPTPKPSTLEPIKIAFKPQQPIQVPPPNIFAASPSAAEQTKTEFQSSNLTSTDEKKPADNETNLCKICIEKEINCVFIECGHLISCLDCSENLKLCPICRATIIKTVKVFKS